MKLRFSRRAETDLVEIADYTLAQWGEAQAARYLDQLEVGCTQLAERPALGRSCDHVRLGLHRFEVGQHVVFYRTSADGILVSRILHQRMLPERHEV